MYSTINVQIFSRNVILINFRAKWLKIDFEETLQTDWE